MAVSSEPTGARSAPSSRSDRSSSAESVGYWQELTETVGAGWNRFWFTPADALPLSLMRIGGGLLAALFFFSFTQDLLLWFGPEGLLPMESIEALVLASPDEPMHRFSLFFGAADDSTLLAIHWSCVVLALLFAAGFLTRVTGIATAIGLLSYIHRIPIITTPIAPVLSVLVIYLTLGPSGRYLSIDSLLRRRKQSLTSSATPEVFLSANLALRLLQVHFAALVLTMGLAKLSFLAWWEGEAVWHLIAQTISRPTDLTGLRPYTFLINAWTHAIVYFELAFPVLIWSRLARPLLIPLGIVLWLSIGLVTGMLMFSIGMTIVALCYIPGDSWRRWGVNPS